MSNEKKVSIIIPVFNEANSIVELLSRVLSQPLPYGLKRELIIVESNSKDGSRELVEKFYLSNRSKVEMRLILQDQPKGKGFAVREGLKAATGDIILIQDADLEYDMGDYPILLSPICENKTDFVLGSRHMSAGSWKIRRFEKNAMKAFLMNLGGVLFHSFFNLLYGVKLTDPTTMYKIFRRSCIENLEFTANRFDFDFELLGKLIRAGYIPLEIPCSYVSRGFDEGKKIRVLYDPWTWIRAIVKYRFVAMPKRIETKSKEPMATMAESEVERQTMHEV